MFINPRAFTFIELIVVVSIIIVISSSSVVYFFDFVNGKRLQTELQSISQGIDDADAQVQHYEIRDYRMQFDVDSLGYTISSDNVEPEYLQTLSMDWSTGSGVLQTTATGATLSWLLKIYAGEKFEEERFLSVLDSFTGSFVSRKNYRFQSYIVTSKINTLEMYYFSEENLNTEDDSLHVTLVEMNTKEDISGTDVTTAQVENIAGRKKIQVNGGTEVPELYLFFEQSGQTEAISISSL